MSPAASGPPVAKPLGTKATPYGFTSPLEGTVETFICGVAGRCHHRVDQKWAGFVHRVNLQDVLSSLTAVSEIVFAVEEIARPNGAPVELKIENRLTNAPLRVTPPVRSADSNPCSGHLHRRQPNRHWVPAPSQVGRADAWRPDRPSSRCDCRSSSCWLWGSRRPLHRRLTRQRAICSWNQRPARSVPVPGRRGRRDA